MIRLFTGNLLWQQEFFVRLGSIICAAINTWQVFRLGMRIKDEHTGWIAACLFTASLYAGMLAGLMILPDAPQMVFWLWALQLMCRIFKSNGTYRNRNRRLLLLGIVIGLCIMSKVHGLFLWGGAFLYILLYNRRMLLNPFLYLALLLTAIIISPILWWNIANDFVTYNYHESRVGFFSHIQWDTFFRQLIGEFLYNNPINVVIIASALIVVRKMKLVNEYFQQHILLAVSLPLIAVVWLMSLFRDTLPHWTGPAYTTLIPLAAAFITNRLRSKQEQPVTPITIKIAIALPAFVLVLLVAGIHWLPVKMGSKEEQQLGSGDLLLDMSGWKQFSKDFDQLYQQDAAGRIMKPGAFILTDYWFPAAHLDYYVTRTVRINLVAAGNLNNIHHYAWLNRFRPSLEEGQDAYYIAISNYFNAPPAPVLNAFQKADPPTVINQYRQGKIVRHFFIYRLKAYRGGIPRNGVLNF
jgi:4-amino-4-deoxy-L-arabinose transferase-like glycosyltransferase